MAEPQANAWMEKIVSLCKRRGFIYQSSEIYGGIGGFWDYGPLGAELKRNVKDLWWRRLVHQREDVVGLDATIIMHPRIWEASGHVDTFADPMSTCRHCKKLVRSDQVIQIAAEKEWFLTLHNYFQKAQWNQFDPGKLRALVRELKKLVRELKKCAPNLALVRNPDSVLNRLTRLTSDPTIHYVPPLPDSLAPAQDRTKFNPLRDERLFLQHLATENFDATGLVYFPCPHCGGELTDPRPFNLMFKTTVGPVEDPDSLAYLRPETAQAIFAQFKNVLETSRQKVPFGIAQIGKAFRNEVTPRNFTFRSREFEQMELEFFIRPDEAVEAICGHVATPAGPGHPGEPQPDWGWQMWHQYWVEERVRFYESIGLPRTSLEAYWQKPEELAHYARACVDILFKFPFGTQELEGIAARSDFDLSQHQRCSGKPMTVFDEELKNAWARLPADQQEALGRRYFETRRHYLLKMGEPAEKADALARADSDALARGWYIPHVIEPSAGVDRLILALICHAYTELTETDAQGRSESRVLLRFHPAVAPVKVGVFPLLKNRPELVARARAVRDQLRDRFPVFYDESGSIGRRYARQDEAGTPFGVTIDFDTLGETPALKDTVTVRFRDTGQQERAPLAELPVWLEAHLR